VIQALKTQIVYETNADYEKSYENICANVMMKAEKTQKGLIWFMFRKTNTAFMLSPNGKLQVKWNDSEEKIVLLKLLQNVLVPTQGQKLEIQPSRQQVWVTYPAPQDFKLYWCEEKTEYSQTKETNIGKTAIDRVLAEVHTSMNQGNYPDAWDAMLVLASTPGNIERETIDKLIKEKELQVQLLNEVSYYTATEKIIGRRQFFYGPNGFMKHQCDKLYEEIMSKLKLYRYLH
jgi:hypothetical protein